MRSASGSARSLRWMEPPEREASVQDPLAFRTAPQLHGALREAVARLRAEVEVELAARSENPVVDLPSGRLVSGGNFEALPLALALENLRVALAHVAEASERRTAALSLALAPARREGRTRVPGLLPYAAADTVAEVRQLAAPATLGSSTLSGVEDHATYAPLALRLLRRALTLTTEVVAIEALHAADLLGVLASVPTGAGTRRVAEALATVFSDHGRGAVSGATGTTAATAATAADALVAEAARFLTTGRAGPHARHESRAAGVGAAAVAGSATTLCGRRGRRRAPSRRRGRRAVRSRARDTAPRPPADAHRS